MSTNSSIAHKRNDGKFEVIYCHWDGHIESVGLVLLNHYNTEDRITALLKLGNISNLEESIEKPEGHSFDTRMDGYTTAYGRDRGEKNQKSRVYKNYTEVLKCESQSYDYLFYDGVWYVNGEELKPLVVNYLKNHNQSNLLL